MADQIKTRVVDTRAALNASDELKTALDQLDASLTEAYNLHAQMLNALALHPPMRPKNVKPIRARAV